MICADEIAKALGVPCLILGGMQKKMQLWDDLYQNRAGWQKQRSNLCGSRLPLPES